MKLGALLLVLSMGAVQPTTYGWVISGSVQGVEWTESCALAADAAGKLTGTCSNAQAGQKYTVTGTVTGTTVAFTHEAEYEGLPLTLQFNGKMAADGSLTGTVDVSPNGASGTFTGKKTVSGAPAADAKP